MPDYMPYIDFDAIELGNLAFEIGDYRCAYRCFAGALKKLNEYQDDRKVAIDMAGTLMQKRRNASGMYNNGRDILQYDTWKFSKSAFVKGKQCLKYLYLDKHHKQDATPPSAATKKRFELGREFEALVRKTDFPDGIDVQQKVRKYAYFNSYTNYLLGQSDNCCLYEATIIEEEVLIMCDVLVQKNGKVDIYEIKSSKAVQEAILNDLQLQYYICKKRFGAQLNSFNVILPTSAALDSWTITDYSDRLEKAMAPVENSIKHFKDILQASLPDIALGKQCHSPYRCAYIEFCTKGMQDSK